MSGDKQANRRIRLLLASLVLVFAAALGRAAWLQVVHASTFARTAELQHQQKTTTPAGRGAILDRSGIELAVGVQATTVFADPFMVTQPTLVAQAAAKAFGIDPNVLYPELVQRKTHFVYLQRFADQKVADAFLAKHFAGVSSYPEEKRTYPQNAVGSQVIGFAGTDNTGLGGLELQYNKQLTGKPGHQTVIRDPLGRTLDTISQTPARSGADIFTTLDDNIQANAEQVLRSTVAQWGARSAEAIVMDPHTGEILAMAQVPGYNGNNSSRTTTALQRNRAITDTYEPGSVFKVVTIGGALTEGIVTPQSRFTLPPCIQIYDACIKDAEPRGTETLSVAQILAHSSNVGAITIAQKLGATGLMDWIDKFGFGKSTGIDFPGESPGQVLPLDQWSGTTIGNFPIGQGIAVTPIQIASAYAAIANGGVWVQPHLVSRIGGRTLNGFKKRRIISPAVDQELKTMLTGVVDEHDATGGEAAIPGYEVAGKTGTAQVPGPQGYNTGKYVASFVGMVPVKDPKLLVLVVVDDPTKNIFGGVVAAPAFAQIASFDLQYLNILPAGSTTH